MHQLKYSKVDHKARFISDANSYMFRHQGAFSREFFNNNVCLHVCTVHR